MLLKWVKTAFKNNKTVLYLYVVMTIYTMINYLEDYILHEVSLISRQPRRNEKRDPENSSCPYVANYERPSRESQDATFFWTEKQISSFRSIQFNIPFSTSLFGGIFSDKFGGQRVVLVGLLLCSVAMSTCYLFMLQSNYIFLAMLLLRKSSYGMIWAALLSLVGKLAEHDQRSLFLSVILSGESSGFFLSYVVSGIVVKWKPISLFSGFVSLVTAIWWWFIYRSSQFPKVRRIKQIPWKTVMTTVSLYSICFLLFSCFLIWYLAMTEYTIYGNQVLFSKANRELVHWFVLSLTSIFSYLFCGFLSNYIISKKYLPASAVRRIFYSVSIVTVFCTLVVVKLVKCNRIVIVTCSIPLYFATAVAWFTTMAAAIEFSPSCSGAVTGVVFVFSVFTYFPLYTTLRDIFVSGDSESDINCWIGLLFTLFFISLVTSLPFICGVIKETSPRIEASLRTQHKNNKLDDPSVSESEQVGEQQSFQGTNPGPSNR